MGGGAPSVKAPQAPDPGQEYQSAISAYMRNAPQLYREESQYQPLYNQMQQGIAGSNIPFYTQAIGQQIPGAQTWLNMAQASASQGAMQQYGQYAGQAAQAAVGASPELQALSRYGTSALGATADPALQALFAQTQQQTGGQVQQLQDLATQAGQSVQPVNQQLQSLYGQVQPMATQGAAALSGLAGQAAANQRSPLWQATAANVQGNLGQLDPLTQQLSTTAQQQLALGGSLSPQQLADAAQAARQAYSARGMLGSSGAIAGEVLGRQAVMQQMLQQREQFASGVSGLVQNQLAQRTAAATGMSQADIAATQANQQLAGQLYGQATGLGFQGTQIGAGLQGQIAQNIQNAQSQQAGLVQAAIGTQQAGMQQAAGLQQSILDQIYRQQQAGAAALGNVYGAQQGAIAGILGAPSGAAQFAQNIGLGSPAFGTGSPNLFQGSGLLQLTNQSAMAQMNANAAAAQMNAQSKGAAQGATMGAVGAIGGALVTGIAVF
jgi:hypothetical protein